MVWITGKNKNGEEVGHIFIECKKCHKSTKIVVRLNDILEWRCTNKKKRRKIEEVFPYLSKNKQNLIANQICGKCKSKSNH